MVKELQLAQRDLVIQAQHKVLAVQMETVVLLQVVFPLVQEEDSALMVRMDLQVRR